jgi:flagellar basal-body rod protein FlgG
MLDSLYIAATGMHAQQLNVDTISNNLANVNTNGYKRARVSFEDTLYRELVRGAPLLGAGTGARFGAGVAVAETAKMFSDGDLKKTDGPLDVAIRGAGFFEVLMPDGSRAYTRSGTLRVNQDGLLATGEGNVVLPAMQVPGDATEIAIDAAGSVTARVPGESSPVEVGRFDVARFVNPAGLNPVGGNLYVPTQKSGDALPGKPGDEGYGSLAQGFLESSNVKLVEEMIGLVVAQRAFEVNARAVQASDELLSLINNLRK